ncbi:hypothetical protein G7Y89_g852 [Cudoniella acicularis]|uniref:Uncharacterized protein n=1 Tax=Cudoniella acicularis TaxID=354080 RepID=A0A8H4RWD8_9HELO|nr:hypothetical protein G7Y89_g852 [Cudoniella acicularis]
MGRKHHSKHKADDPWQSPEGPDGIPRGLQVMADNTPDLKTGFPWPKILDVYGISKDDWRTFCFALAEPLEPWLGQTGIAYEIEKILDICAEWDVQYFRKKGLIMRLDMPGEEKYGLDFMDLYYQGDGNRWVYNVALSFAAKLDKGKVKDEKLKNLAKVRLKGFESTRVVLDPIKVLDNKKLADSRGWTNWTKHCADARCANNRNPPPPVPIDNIPWDFNTNPIPKRVDRWPPSKHLYYERFRGKVIWIHSYGRYDSWANYAYCYFIPDPDSMDQSGIPRGEGPIYPCDEVPRRPIPRRAGGDVAYKHAWNGKFL